MTKIGQIDKKKWAKIDKKIEICQSVPKNKSKKLINRKNM